MISLTDVLDELFKHIKFDRSFVDKLYKYQSWFVNKDSQHLKFFGGNLIGVESIRFRTSDAVKFFKDVCYQDASYVEKELKTVTTIVQDYKITSDALNLVLMYIIHRVLTSPLLTKEQKEKGSIDTALIFFYRCIAIRQSEWFHFPADERISQAAYGKLNKKFLLKRVGTWAGVMLYRAKELLDPSGVHYKDLLDFNDDSRVTYAISDGENRIREMYKTYYAVFDETYREGSRIYQVSSTITDAEGQERLREKVKSTEQAVNNIRHLVIDKNGFVKPEYIKIITEINTNTSYRMLDSTVSWLSDFYSDPKWHKKIDEWLRLIVIHSFHILSEATDQETKDLAMALILLKNQYLATRSTDKELLKIRELGDEIILEANGKVNPSLSMATRTATILYITLRALISKK